MLKLPKDASLSFLIGGEMGDRIRALDWSRTSLGELVSWPPALKTLVGLMLVSRQPMFIAWGSGRTWLYNDAFIPIMGNKHPAGLGGHALDEVWSEARAVLVPLFDRVFSGSPVQMDDFALMLDRCGRLEEAHFSFSYNPVRDESGREAGLFGICTETTQARRAEQTLRESAAQLREADRCKDAFLATLAHELRNPLAPIRQAALIASSPKVTAAQLRWCHDVIDRQTTHMALLLDDLLDISRITRGQLPLRKERLELKRVIDAALETARPLITARGHTLRLTVPDSPLSLDADPLRLSQVVSNLLTNAAKYTDKGGHIELAASATPGEIVITVRDSGMGIESEMLPRVFEMFSQAKSALERAEGGLGIGLALAKGIIDLHGGSIAARSPGPGRGSEFIVSLPRERVD